jgi:hypothetical protein
MTTRKCQNRPVWENPNWTPSLAYPRKYQEVTTNITAMASLTCKPRAKYWLSVSERSTVGSGGDQQESLTQKSAQVGRAIACRAPRFLAFISATNGIVMRASVIEALAKCVKKLLYKTVRARLGTRSAPDRMNTESLRRWAKRLTDQSPWKALGKQQTAWSDT